MALSEILKCLLSFSQIKKIITRNYKIAKGEWCFIVIVPSNGWICIQHRSTKIVQFFLQKNKSNLLVGTVTLWFCNTLALEVAGEGYMGTLLF